MKAKFTVYSMLIITSLVSSRAQACVCNYQGSFVELARHAKLVVRVKVKHFNQTKRYSLFSVTESLSGTTTAKDFIIYGGEGLTCRPLAHEFTTGTEWVIIPHRDGKEPNGIPRYRLSNCGGYYLRVRKGKVYGHVIPDKNRISTQQIPLHQSYSYKRFKSLLREYKTQPKR